MNKLAFDTFGDFTLGEFLDLVKPWQLWKENRPNSAMQYLFVGEDAGFIRVGQGHQYEKVRMNNAFWEKSSNPPAVALMDIYLGLRLGSPLVEEGPWTYSLVMSDWRTLSVQKREGSLQFSVYNMSDAKIPQQGAACRSILKNFSMSPRRCASQAKA